MSQSCLNSKELPERCLCGLHGYGCRDVVPNGLMRPSGILAGDCPLPWLRITLDGTSLFPLFHASPSLIQGEKQK